MLPIDFLAAILATTQAVEIWNHGSIFATRRAKLEVSDSWIASLLRCMFCLTVWVSWLTCLSVLAFNWLPGLFFPLKVFVYGLAIARGANLLNDFTHEWNRTPRQVLGDYYDTSEDSDDAP